MTQSDKPQDLVFELLLVSTGARNGLRQTYTDEDWNGALAIANSQAMVEKRNDYIHFWVWFRLANSLPRMKFRTVKRYFFV